MPCLITTDNTGFSAQARYSMSLEELFWHNGRRMRIISVRPTRGPVRERDVKTWRI